MNGKEIVVVVRDKIARPPAAVIVCDNTDYTIRFDFDAEWNAFPIKTARFVHNGVKHDVVFEGDVCAVPRLHDTAECKVGVFAGDLSTTNAAYIRCIKSILSAGGSPADPEEYVYNQIMEMLNELQQRGEITEEDVAEAVDKYLAANPPTGEIQPAVETRIAEGRALCIYGKKHDTPITINAIYGRTDQPVAPGALYSVGASESMTITAKGAGDSGSVSITVPELSGIPVKIGGNYNDGDGIEWLCDEIDYKGGVYIQRVAKRVFSGLPSENWAKDGVNRFRSISLADYDYATPANNDTVATMICDRYVPTTGNRTYSKTTGTSMQLWNATAMSVAVYFYDDACKDMTVDEWKRHLSSNPVTCIFKLNTPVVHSIADACPEIAVDSGNVLVTNSEFAYMRIEYEADGRSINPNAGLTVNDFGKYVHIPRLMLYGDTDSMTKDTPAKMQCVYRGANNYINDPTGAGKRDEDMKFSAHANVKWQGSSSLNFPEKNYTLQLYADTECTTKLPIALREKWGAQSKYCLKANFIDPTSCRNVVSARLWAKCVMSRPTASESYARMHDLPNAGAVDGYPILLFINDRFNGVYTFNIPKDEWTFGMDDGTGNNAVLSGETWAKSVTFDVTDPAFTYPVIDGTDFDWEVSPADKTAGKASFHKIYDALKMPESSASEIASKKSALSACIDIYSVIDYGLFIDALCLTDNSGKNALYATYDGIKWIMSAYDMDTAFGMHWSGASYYDVNMRVNGNGLTRTVARLFPEELTERKAVLNEVLSAASICAAVDNFVIDIPLEAVQKDWAQWPDKAGANAYGVGQLKTFALLREIYRKGGE